MRLDATALMYRFATNIPESESRTQLESRLIEAVTSGDVASVQRLGEELQGAMVVDQSLMQDLVLEAVSIASVDLMVELVDLLSTKNMYCYEVSCRGMQQTPASATYPKVTCEVSSKRVARFPIANIFCEKL